MALCDSLVGEQHCQAAKPASSEAAVLRRAPEGTGNVVAAPGCCLTALTEQGRTKAVVHLTAKDATA
jgi:hypothetical protein